VSKSNRDRRRNGSGSVVDRVSRRQLLLVGGTIGGSAIGVGWLVSSNSDELDQLTAVEKQLIRTATRIGNSDLSNPQENERVHQTAVSAVESVTSLPTENLPDDPQTEQRIQAINSAGDYYKQLTKPLNLGISVVSTLAASEGAVINHTGDQGDNIIGDPKLDQFKSSLEELSEYQISIEPTGIEGEPLIPDQDRVVTDLRAQQTILENHLRAQRTYIESSLQIPTAVRALEESHYETARTSLRSVERTLSAGESSTKTTHRLGHSGLSLEEYNSIFKLRKQGVEKLLSVSNDSNSTDQHQSSFNEAIELFLESRSHVL